MNMTIFNVLSLIGGLALFLFGMNIMGQSLEKAAGNRLKGILARMTDSPLRGLLLGLAVTAVIQSSSATTVMVVGFVNSGLMQLRQAIGVIMGANIGTTVTAWLLSLTSIDGESLFVQLLKPSSFTPVLAAVGIVMLMRPKKGSRHDIATVLLGFAVLMVGMETMSDAVKPLADSEAFTRLFVAFENPLLGVLAGTLLTAIIQSSSASVGILQALSATGAVSYGAAIPIIMGQNIGTCATAMLASVGTTKAARRAALVHLYFNVLGTVICLIFFWGAQQIFQLPILSESVDEFSIAVIHSVFNISCTVILFPLRGVLEKMALRTVRESPEQRSAEMLDPRLLSTPTVAAERCRSVIGEMAGVVYRNLLLALSLLVEPNEKVFEQVAAEEEKIDEYEDALGSYLVKLSTCRLNDADSRAVTLWLHAISDFERIGDHAMNIAERGQTMAQEGTIFSGTAKAQLQVLTDALTEIVTMAVTAFREEDAAQARRVEPLEQVIDELNDRMKDGHIERLRAGECTLETGFAFNDILTDIERISDHCSNLAASQIAMSQHSMDTHAYLESVKTEKNAEFTAEFERYREKYSLDAHQ